MVDVQDLSVMGQLIDNMIILSGKLEEFYSKNDQVNFMKTKKEIIDIQNKISEMTE